MKRGNTAKRLAEIMSERGLKQIDILNLALPYCIKYDEKMNKSDISQYVSGKVEPSQTKLCILGMALNVSESWLMGFDTPKQREYGSFEAEKDFNFLYKFSKLNERDKQIVSNLMDSMLSK